jgi:glycosyltransferase involved in cell wall biosynthesis
LYHLYGRFFYYTKIQTNVVHRRGRLCRQFREKGYYNFNVKILFLAGREISYTRNDVNLRALRRIGSVDVLGPKTRPGSLSRSSVKIALQAMPRLLHGDYDLIFVGFFGHMLMLPVGLSRRKPVLFDAFVSTYDTLIEDRGISSKDSLIARSAIWLDRTACNLADIVMLDTPLQVKYFKERFDLSAKEFISCPVGCNEDIFFPRENSKLQRQQSIVNSYTSYLPLHGVDIIIKAAALLRSAPICFRLIGEGQTYHQSHTLAHRMDLQNIEFIPSMSLEELAIEIASADICLGGHFGATGKAGRVVPGKIYQMIAMERAVIATTTPANLQLLHHLENAYLCPPNDPDALASAILRLHENRELRRQLAEGGRRLYQEHCSERVVTEIIGRNVEALTRKL